MPQQNCEDRRMRLLNGCCPVHNIKMRSATDTAAVGDETLHECPRKDCHITATGSSSNPAAGLSLTEGFLFLLDPYKLALPIYGPDQVKGGISSDIASIVLNRFSIVHRVDGGSDIGIDFICEMRDGDLPAGKNFNVQCKTLPDALKDGQTEFGITVNVATARYWLQQTVPTIMLVCNPQNGDVIWTEPAVQLNAMDPVWRTQSTVSIACSLTNRFSCFAAPPDALIAAARRGTAVLATAFRERLYPIHARINADPLGADTKDSEVAKYLVEDEFALRELLDLISELRKLPPRHIESIVGRMESLSSGLRFRAENVIRQSNRVERECSGSSSDLNDFDIFEQGIGDGFTVNSVNAKVSASIETARLDYESGDAFANLVKALKELETLRSTLDKMEDGTERYQTVS